MKLRLAVAFLLSIAPEGPLAAELRPETVDGWEAYVRETEKRVDREIASEKGFLALDFLDGMERVDCQSRIRKGEVCVLERETLSEDGKSIDVPHGEVHHWYGAVFVPGADLEQVLSWVTSYDDREKYYPEVESSRLLSREGDAYEIFLRLKRTKIITVQYDTEHRVTYARHGESRASSRSVATRIRELERPGEPGESERPVGQDRGFLWGLQSYWRFEERDSGTLVECESVSLSRSIPAAAQWIVKSFVDSVPRESLESTLLPFRAHLGSKP